MESEFPAQKKWVLSRPAKGLLTLLSLLMSIVLMVLIWQQWKSVYRQMPESVNGISNHEALNKFIEQQCNATEEKRAAQFQWSDGRCGVGSNRQPYKIPTGVFIQSMMFSTSSNVNLTGYIWQKYPSNYPFQRGVEFPEQIMSGDTLIKLDYCDQYSHENFPKDLADCTLMGWYFDVTLRQSFDYQKYPLDFLNIWLRIWPKEFAYNKQVLLIPDFDAYADDLKTFGLDQDLVPGEWEVDTSYFSYRDISYNTNFGFESGLHNVNTHYQELHFDLGVKRKFLSAFIKNLVPLFVVALLLFSAVMTISGDKEQSDRFGFSTAGLLGTCSALFFVVMISHVQVRGMFPGSGLVYIEYFYLMMYLYILLTALNGYLFSLKGLEGFWLLHYGDNIVAKVSFWPVLLFCMLVVSWAVL